MTARGGVDGKRQPRRASADNRQVFTRSRRKDRHFGFVTSARVNQARCHLADKDLIEAGLVAANAGVDLIGATRLRFGEQLGIGEERTGHRHHIGIAARQNIVGDLRIVNSVGGNQWNRHMAFELAGDPAKGAARYRRSNGRDPRFVPADPGVDYRRARGFDRLGEAHGFIKGAAVVD